MSLLSRNALGRFFLEGMKHIQNVFKTDGIDGAKGIAIEVVANLKDAAAEPLRSLAEAGCSPS